MNPDRLDDSVCAMYKRSVCVRAALVSALVSPMSAASPARADLLIGDFSGSASTAPYPILRFSDDANGNIEPIGGFTTDLSGMRP